MFSIIRNLTPTDGIFGDSVMNQKIKFSPKKEFLISNLNEYKNLKTTRDLLKNLSNPVIYWVDAYKAMRFYLKNKSLHNLKEDLIFSVGSSNIMTVLFPGNCNSKNISERMTASVCAISTTQFEGGFFYEAASILRPDVLVMHMRSMSCFKHYPSRSWEKMLYDTLHRESGILKNKRVFRL